MNGYMLIQLYSILAASPLAHSISVDAEVVTWAIHDILIQGIFGYWLLIGHDSKEAGQVFTFFFFFLFLLFDTQSNTQFLDNLFSRASGLTASAKKAAFASVRMMERRRFLTKQTRALLSSIDNKCKSELFVTPGDKIAVQGKVLKLSISFLVFFYIKTCCRLRMVDITCWNYWIVREKNPRFLFSNRLILFYNKVDSRIERYPLNVA